MGITIGNDSLPCLSVKVHSYVKSMLLRYYLRPFTTIISQYFDRFLYLDGFAGPGKLCFDLAGRKYFCDGSPLVALKTKVPFTDYVFIELDPDLAKALELRCQLVSTLRSPIILRGKTVIRPCQTFLAGFLGTVMYSPI